MRSSVDLPQPDGPDQHHELAVGDVEADAVDDLGRAEGFLDVAETRRMPCVDPSALHRAGGEPADHVALERVVDRRRRQRVDQAGRHQQLPRRIVGGEEVAERDRRA